MTTRKAASFKLIVGLVFALGTSLAYSEHDKSDRVTTNDSSTFIGEIRGMRYATLTLKTVAAGTLNIEWRHITSLSSQFEYQVRLTNGDTHYGKLEKTDQLYELKIIGHSDELVVKFDEVFEIEPIEHGFLKRLDGSLGFGLNFTQANGALQYNFDANAHYRTTGHYSTLSAQSIFNTQEEGEKSSQHYLQFLMAQVARGQWGTFELGQIQSNPNQGYDQRFVIGGGASNFFIESSKHFMAANFGVVYNREYVTDSPDINNSAEAIIGVSYRRFRRSTYSPNFEFGLQTFPSLTESSRLRALLNIKLSWKIIKDFQFSFQVIDHYDSEPPEEDANNNDMSVITSIGYIF